MSRLALLLTLFLIPLLSQAREWRSVNGTRTFIADFVSNDGNRVTLRRKDGRIITFDLTKLHSEDQDWIKTQRPTPSQTNRTPRTHQDPKGTAFGNLEFGDDRKTVEEKLSKSPLVEASINETLLGRTGLNGVFHTKASIGGLKCYLYFDWTDQGKLREVSLQTQGVAADRYQGLQENWSELITLLNKLHGNPKQGNSYPARQDLQDGLVLGSHLWRTGEGHSVILGTGQERTQYQVVVRITSEVITPRPSSTPSPSSGRPKSPIFPE